MNEFRAYKQAGAPEVRAAGDVLTIEGYAAVYSRLSQNLGGFVEMVDVGAFTDTLARQGERNIMGLGNHDVSWLLGTTDSGTLRLESDATGLRYLIDLDMADPDAVRMAAKVRTGKMRGSSFSFRTIEDSWSATTQGFPLRNLVAAELFDVGPVSQPAYRSTEEAGYSVALRSLSAFIDRPFEQVAEAARANTLTDLINRDLGVEPEVPAEGEAPPPGDTAGVPAKRGRRNPSTRAA